MHKNIQKLNSTKYSTTAFLWATIPVDLCHNKRGAIRMTVTAVNILLLLAVGFFKA